MRRRIFLALMLGVALASARASAQEGAQAQARPDRVTLEELKEMLAAERPVLVLDVRGTAERRIKGATHVPLDQLESKLAELPRDREIVTYCA